MPRKGPPPLRKEEGAEEEEEEEEEDERAGPRCAPHGPAGARQGPDLRARTAARVGSALCTRCPAALAQKTNLGEAMGKGGGGGRRREEEEGVAAPGPNPGAYSASKQKKKFLGRALLSDGKKAGVPVNRPCAAARAGVVYGRHLWLGSCRAGGRTKKKGRKNTTVSACASLRFLALRPRAGPSACPSSDSRLP